MLECKSYSAAELLAATHTRTNVSAERRLTTQNIRWEKNGNGKRAQYTISDIPDPLRTYIVFDLGFPPQTDVKKFRDFAFHFLGDDVFRAMPQEMMEEAMREMGQGVSRQTMANYIERLQALDYINRSTDCVYYRVYKEYGVQKHDVVTKEEYCAAWKIYWDKIGCGYSSQAAYSTMYNAFGGVPRKQAKYDENAFYKKEIDFLYDLVVESKINEISG